MRGEKKQNLFHPCLEDDVRAEASNSEILTIAILAFLFFGGNLKTLPFVFQHNLFTKISYSRFLRGLSDLVNNWGPTLFCLGDIYHQKGSMLMG
jgi:hypothetical protein